MNRAEKTIVIVLRLIGITGLFAIPAIFLPMGWMSAIHEYLGLGAMPEGPIVQYLARSLSAFYAVFSMIVLFVSLDVRKYRSLIKLMALIFLAMGLVLLGTDLSAGMPLSWTLTEGPPTIIVGLLVLWLQPKIHQDVAGGSVA